MSCTETESPLAEDWDFEVYRLTRARYVEFYSFVADNYAPFYSRPIECRRRIGG